KRCLSRARRRYFAHHFLRLLVLADALERRLPEHAAMRDAGEFRLDHELRLDPHDILAALVRRQSDRPLVGAQRRKTLEQIVRYFLGVAGADPSGVTKRAILMH